MERFREILLDVWREACRHIEIAESTATISRLLAAQMPLGRVLVRRIAWDQRWLETVAEGPPGLEPSAPARTAGSAAQLRALREWCSKPGVSRWGRQAAAPARLAALVAPGGAAGEFLAGPLRDARGPAGVLVLVPAPGHAFGPRDEAIAAVLLEPFGVALDNDHRVREMTALREAAEADKRSLLTRLGRTEVGETVVGGDGGLRPVLERIELVARSDVPVLVLGETGTGKELAARAIHGRSPRAAGPFLRVNCGAIPTELVDSQLFGHERGAFTGAVGARPGWFERADGGTLFLDEIGELPPAAQVRLLRVLQDGWLERVGGTQPLRVDVRVVAATHRDLAAMVAEGRFRSDLWYRIAVFPLLLPPLRERPADIPDLARHFCDRAATRFHLPAVYPTEEDLALLEAYPWPGNVRELASVIDRAAILGNGGRLEVATALGGPALPAPPASPPLPPVAAAARGIAPLDEAIRRHLEAALAACRGRIEGPRGAAALLRVNPHTLRSRLRKLGVEWGKFRDW